MEGIVIAHTLAARLLAAPGTIRMNRSGRRGRRFLISSPASGCHVMNDLVAVKLESVRVKPEAAPAVEEPAVVRALADIAADSQRQPETYLRDTVVPHGGE